MRTIMTANEQLKQLFLHTMVALHNLEQVAILLEDLKDFEEARHEILKSFLNVQAQKALIERKLIFAEGEFKERKPA